MPDPAADFLLACVRADLGLGRATAIQTTAERITDWPRVEALLMHHGLVPLVHARALPVAAESMPPGFRDALEEASRQNAVEALALTGELLRLLDRFADAGVPVLTFKGPLLAQQLYGQLARRVFSDLDLLVPTTHADAGAAILREEGYQPQFDLNPKDFARYRRIRPELAWKHPRRELLVDFHWHLVAQGYAFSEALEADWTTQATFPLVGREVRTLPKSQLLPFLCVHGAKHDWRSLSGLADLAALLAQWTDPEWATLAATATAGIRRPVQLALALAHQVLGTPIPAAIDAAWGPDPRMTRLATRAAAQLWKTDVPHRDAIFRGILSGFREHWRHAWKVVGQATPLEWEWLPLHERLHFLYPAVRGLRLTLKHLKLGRSDP